MRLLSPKEQLTRMPRLRILELHVTHQCNLACDSCSHYSNHGHAGQTSVWEAEQWLGAWSSRLAVDHFRLLGGEPTIHPELPAFVLLVRRFWPQSRIRIVTNGFFLHRHPDLPAAISSVGNADIAVSVHHGSDEYRKRLRPVFKLLEQWKRDHGISVEIKQSYSHWTQRYHGFGEGMSPFEDGLPRRSWEICPARRCKQLYQGKLWKCAPLAYLQLQNAKYKLSEKWQVPLAYKALDPICSDRELKQFLALEDEPVCSMCPADRVPFTLPIPLRNAAASAGERVR